MISKMTRRGESGLARSLPQRAALYMTLRSKFTFYLVVVHLLFASVAIYLLVQQRYWLLAAEAVFIISLAWGIKLVKELFGTLDLINTGTQFIQDSDFTTRFAPVGQIEMDRLLGVYNQMVDNLREERVRQQEQHYFLDKIMTASPSGIITCDFDDRITLVNPAAERMMQAPVDELLGRRLTEIGTQFARLLDELKIGDAQVLHLLGRRRVKCQKSEFLDRGFARRFILMEELTEELRRSEKSAYEKLIRMMSHEVNNTVGAANSLLHSCQIYAEQLSDEDREDFQMALRVAIDRTDRLSEFMRSFADVIRLPPPNRQPCDLKRLITDVIWLFRAESARRNVIFEWDVQAESAPSMIDRMQIEQVFINIIKNGLEAIGSGGKITIRLFNESERAGIAIEDSGGALTPEVQSQIFTPFFSTKENGQGIGLTLVQEILERHGCEFSLEGELGVWTRFTVLF
jgi:two-component system nitrogen regulation sensor histidine kinase NtrY